MPTIKDVAKRAGVAPITASRVINNSGYVSDATRLRVEAAVEALGYVPNRVARSLRSKQTHTLALVLTDITNPFWTTVARGVEDVASGDGFSVILCNTDESASKEESYVRVLLQKQVDGFLLVPAHSAARTVALIQKQKVPLVVLDRAVSAAVDIVRSDSIGGAYQLTQHLLDLGHRRIAMLSGPKEVSTAEDRVIGYRKALMDAGIPVDERMVIYRAFTQEGGYAMTQQVLALSPRPTALFAANNFIAIGAFKALREAGLSVPEDMALVAFDDLPPTFTMDPFLTVAAQRAYEMGERATRLLLERLQGEARSKEVAPPHQEVAPPHQEVAPSHQEGAPEPQEIVLQTDLVVRRSSASASSASVSSASASSKVEG
ncbi:MAG: LacI family DNA-binding transcriptional regulator [Anaerolineae bacterium]